MTSIDHNNIIVCRKIKWYAAKYRSIINIKIKLLFCTSKITYEYI